MLRHYTPQEDVKAFHKAFEILIETIPIIPDAETIQLREDLIREEVDELIAALRAGDLVGVADGLADLLYVTYGTAVSCGIHMPPIFQEVHRSNMTKVGGHKAPNGKWIKPETYEPANLVPILEEQGALFRREPEPLPMNRYNPGSEDMGGSDYE